MTVRTNHNYGMKGCRWCENEFIAKRSNQIYCNDQCCKAATNKKILDRYHTNKDEKNNKEKYCECGSKLSVYNQDTKCHSCQLKKEHAKRVDLLRSLGFSYESDD